MFNRWNSWVETSKQGRAINYFGSQFRSFMIEINFEKKKNLSPFASIVFRIDTLMRFLFLYLRGDESLFIRVFLAFCILSLYLPHMAFFSHIWEKWFCYEAADFITLKQEQRIVLKSIFTISFDAPLSFSLSLSE